MSILRKEEKKEGKKRKTKQFLDFSAERARLSMLFLARQTYSFDHPILSLSLSSLLLHPRMWKRDSTREREGRRKVKRHAFLSLSPTPPSYLSDVLTGGIKRSHETGKPQSANTPWGRHEYRRIGNRLALGIRRQPPGLPVFFRYLSPPLRLESNGNPRQTSCEESGINVLLPLSISLSRYPLYRGTTTTPLLGPRYLRSSISS